MRWLVIALVATLGLPHSVDAEQSPPAISVAIAHSGDDLVGAAVVYHLKEAIRASKGYSLIAPEDRASYAFTLSP
jgi:hypothetical protein